MKHSTKRAGRKLIRSEQTQQHPTLAGLDDAFREMINWSGPEAPLTLKGMEIQMLRLPNDGVNPCDGAYLTAVDGQLIDKADAEKSQADLGVHWPACLDYLRPLPVVEHKAGAVIWDHLEVETTNDWTDWTKAMLGLDGADQSTVRACQAALFGAFVTGGGTTRLEPILLALATFVHAHPRFSDMAGKAEWHLPYGQNTLYRVRRHKASTARKRGLKHRP